jgi:hypothetical protein
MTRLLALLMTTIALVAAGCGGGTSKEDYEEEVSKIGDTLEEQFNEIGRDIQSAGDLKNAAPEIEKGAQALDDTAADLDEIDPPDDASDAHDKIVSGVEDLADDFRAAANAAEAENAQKVLSLFGDIQASDGAKKITEARQELKDQGYDVQE